MQENVSYENRQKRARKMHAMVNRLLQIKKANRSKHASQNVLKQRAMKLARALIRKKVAGLQGAKYSSLSTSQKISVDKLLEKVPHNRIAGLANRLFSVVARAEVHRLSVYRKKKKAQLKEAHVSHKHRMRRKADAEKNAHKRGIGRHNQPHRLTKGGQGRRANAQARLSVLKRKFPQIKMSKMNPMQQSAIRAFITGKDNETIKDVSKALSSTGRHKRTDRRRISQDNYNTYKTADSGSHRGYQFNSVQADKYAECLVEANYDKFKKLFLKGFVEKDKIEQYRRIFSDLRNSIRYQRYQADIADIVDNLVDLITKDDVIYRRIRLNIQGRH